MRCQAKEPLRVLSAAERMHLERLVSATSEQVDRSRRARALLALAQAASVAGAGLTRRVESRSRLECGARVVAAPSPSTPVPHRRCGKGYRQSYTPDRNRRSGIVGTTNTQTLDRQNRIWKVRLASLPGVVPLFAKQNTSASRLITG
jgi:hypothetical protein